MKDVLTHFTKKWGNLKINQTQQGVAQKKLVNGKGWSTLELSMADQGVPSRPNLLFWLRTIENCVPD